MPPRARPLPPEERRRVLLDVARPLVVEHGRAVRTKDVAEAAGVAEGTLFRIFETKDELIAAVVADAVDPAPFVRRLEQVERTEPLEERLLAVVEAFHERFRGAFELMAAVGMAAPPESPRGGAGQRCAKGGPSAVEEGWRSEVSRLVTGIIQPDAERLTVAPERLAQYLRLLCFAGAHPHITVGDPLGPHEIVDVVLHGVLQE